MRYGIILLPRVLYARNFVKGVSFPPYYDDFFEILGDVLFDGLAMRTTSSYFKEKDSEESDEDENDEDESDDYSREEEDDTRTIVSIITNNTTNSRPRIMPKFVGASIEPEIIRGSRNSADQATLQAATTISGLCQT